jgi:hypothetical protein
MNSIYKTSLKYLNFKNKYFILALPLSVFVYKVPRNLEYHAVSWKYIQFACADF